LAAKYLNRKIRVRRDANHIELDLVAANGDALSIPVSISDHRLLLNHYGFYIDTKEKETPVQISLADAAENRLPKDLPEILILGTTTMGISDVRPSPLSPVANGVEHHVAAVENILRKDFLIREPNHVMFELLLSLVVAAIFIILLSKADALVCLIVLIAGYNLIELIDQKFFFGQGKLIHLGFLHIQNVSIFSSMILFRFFVEEREKRKVKGAFQQYLNPSVINKLLSSPEALKLGGEKRELTVFFSDVRGFTSISEMLSPETLASLLNEYFTPMTDIVLESGGLLDKYIGDALMAVWGAPLPMPDHADRALHSSLRMLDALDKLRENWKERNLPAIDIGCGINTGMMVVGNMGSTQRFDYTVLGDAVNLGSRLEGITKEYGVRVICSEATRRQLRRPEDFVLRELDSIKVKGKNEPIVIYEVMRFSSDKREFALRIKSLFEEGLNKYRARDFEGAMHMMLQILQFSAQDGPASVFLERCEYYKENPPSEIWDGVWVMKTK
jgi:adenylate cyclase